MAFTTASLPNDGRTTHFAVSYLDTLSKADGVDRALELLACCESDLAKICSWFIGVDFQFSFPIGVQIGGQSSGAGWQDPPDISNWFGFNPTVTISPGPSPTTGLIRYLLVSEVTEMYMASQQKDWYQSTSLFSGADEGSMGESLSRFLASEFLQSAGISQAIYPGFAVAHNWLNDDPGRPDRIDSAPDDIAPDAWTGCGTCFLFYLKDQLHKSIQDIVASPAPTLGGVYTNLTGKADGWSSFQELVNSHYPFDKGRKYYPPLDSIFPVAELTHFMVPLALSWIENDPNIAVLVLGPAIPVDVDVALSSDDPATIAFPAPSVALNSSSQIKLKIPVQPAGFVSKVVNLTATYAGTTLHRSVQVFRPEDLPVTPLEIKLVFGQDPCAPHFIEGSAESFLIANSNVVRDHTGLTYKWTVTGATAPVTNAPVLEIPSLPAAGTEVTVEATIRNVYGIHSTSVFKFTTVEKAPDLEEVIRRFQCELGQIKAINSHIPPWVPIEVGSILPPPGQLASIEKQAGLLTIAARRVLESARAIQIRREALEKQQAAK